MLPSFDELKKLAEENPEELENLRKEMVQKTIDSAPEWQQRRLRGLQFQIDMEREKAKKPVNACIKISKRGDGFRGSSGSQKVDKCFK